MIFKETPISGEDIFYLCEYIPKSHASEKHIADTRSENLVLAFKDRHRNMHDTAVSTVAKSLELQLDGSFSLVAIPPSKVKHNDSSSPHELIRRLVADLGNDKDIVDASDCLYRMYDIESQHLQKGKRDESVLIESTGIRNVEKIHNRDVLLVDDITTSGNSFNIARKMLYENGAKSVTCFAVGKTITADNLHPAVILDLDGTLFQSETVEMKQLRLDKKWDRAKEAAARVAPFDGAQDFIDMLNELEIDYRVVTSSPSSYAYILTDRLSIPREKVIAYNHTKKHKPNIEPYMKAKQGMMIYEPCIIVIGNEEYDIMPSNKLGMTSVYITGANQQNKYDKKELDYHAENIQWCCDNLHTLLEKSLKVWDSLASDYDKLHAPQKISHIKEFIQNRKRK